MPSTQAMPVPLKLTAGEYGEMLAKLANKLELYSNSDGSTDATEDLKRGFAKFDAACPFHESEIFQTTLMVKFRAELAEYYPAATPARKH